MSQFGSTHGSRVLTVLAVPYTDTTSTGADTVSLRAFQQRTVCTYSCVFAPQFWPYISILNWRPLDACELGTTSIIYT